MELPSQQDFEAFRAGHTYTLPGLFSQITDPANINAVAENVSGAAQNDAARKSRVSQLIAEMRNYSADIEQTKNTIEREHADIAAYVKAAKERVQSMKSELNEKHDLMELRKEQSQDLKHKYSADFHSSRLGLWRPLHMQTRGILYTTSVVFGLISIIAVAFLITARQTSPARTATNTRGAGTPANPINPSGSTSLFEPSNNYGRVAGGFMKLRQKK